MLIANVPETKVSHLFDASVTPSVLALSGKINNFDEKYHEMYLLKGLKIGDKKGPKPLCLLGSEALNRIFD